MSDAITISTFDNLDKKIEDLVWEHDITHLEAVIMFSEIMGIEEDVLGAMILRYDRLVETLRLEAERLNFIEKENRLEFNEPI
jgi:hypothetical protein